MHSPSLLSNLLRLCSSTNFINIQILTLYSSPPFLIIETTYNILLTALPYYRAYLHYTPHRPSLLSTLFHYTLRRLAVSFSLLSAVFGNYWFRQNRVCLGISIVHVGQYVSPLLSALSSVLSIPHYGCLSMSSTFVSPFRHKQFLAV